MEAGQLKTVNCEFASRKSLRFDTFNKLSHLSTLQLQRVGGHALPKAPSASVYFG